MFVWFVVSRLVILCFYLSQTSRLRPRWAVFSDPCATLKQPLGYKYAWDVVLRAYTGVRPYDVVMSRPWGTRASCLRQINPFNLFHSLLLRGRIRPVRDKIRCSVQSAESADSFPPDTKKRCTRNVSTANALRTCLFSPYKPLRMGGGKIEHPICLHSAHRLQEPKPTLVCRVSHTQGDVFS